jgi:hypothetical protein
MIFFATDEKYRPIHVGDIFQAHGAMRTVEFKVMQIEGDSVAFIGNMDYLTYCPQINQQKVKKEMMEKNLWILL